MCGIAGHWMTDACESAAEIARIMASQVSHRGPDSRGVWVNNSGNLALAHQRLAVLDLSDAGHQPMVSHCGRYVITFNGEIYNHLALRRALNASIPGIPWRGQSDTETLLAYVTYRGLEAALEAATGMFACAVWDTAEQCLYLARDRMGEKPLYYGWQGGDFLFGSELKALKAHPSFSADVDRSALKLFLRYNYVPGPYSIYERIKKLPPGSFLKLDRDGHAARIYPTPTRYWSLGDVAEYGISHRFPGSEYEALEVLEGKLSAAVRDQMLSDVPLGFLLSGGIDSSLICALAQKVSKQTIRTFSVGFEDKTYDEAAYARKVADYLGSEHIELVVGPDDALGLVIKLPSIYDEPFADSSQLPTFMVMNLVKQHITVALSGDGGDELFGGYNRYKYLPGLWKKLAKVPAPLRGVLASSSQHLPATSMNRFSRITGIPQFGDKAHKLAQRLRHLGDVDDFYLSFLSEWSELEDLVIGAPNASTLLDNRADWPRLGDPVERMMALDALTYLPDDILVKVDRAAMSVSLETRAPFLDRDLVEFAWCLPLDMKLREGKNKFLLRQLLQRHIPMKLFERPKMGFGIPLDQWLRGPLRDWADELLNDDRLKMEGFFHPLPVRRAWESHLSGKFNYGYRLWSVLMFQVWLQYR